MKSISNDLLNHLGEEVVTIATCLYLVRKDGVEIFSTEHDVDLAIDGDTYESSLGFNRTDVVNTSSMSVDNLEIMGVLDTDKISEEDLRAGKYDYAEVYLFLVNYKDLSQGILRLRRGILGEVVLGDNGLFTAELRGMVQLYSQRIGEVYSPECRADIGDSRCKIDLAPLTVETTVASVINRRTITVVSGSEADEYYTHGALTFETGNNAGFSIEIKSWLLSTKQIEMYLPTPYPIQAGDEVSFYPGCDKRIATCFDKFNNVINFRGEPYVPEPGLLVRFPDVRN
jgi:uncharacterized phage protein (TIGR02218 family)